MMQHLGCMLLGRIPVKLLRVRSKVCVGEAFAQRTTQAQGRQVLGSDVLKMGPTDRKRRIVAKGIPLTGLLLVKCFPLVETLVWVMGDGINPRPAGGGGV